MFFNPPINQHKVNRLGVGYIDPLKYVRRVRVCFDPLPRCWITFRFHIIKDESIVKAASSDGPCGLLAVCLVFNIKMCYDVDYWAIKTLACSCVKKGS